MNALPSRKTRPDAPTSGRYTADPGRSAVSFSTRRRDADVRSERFLHADLYPDLRFVSSGVTLDGPSWSVTGQLTVKAVKGTVTWRIEPGPAADDDPLVLRARARIDRFQFGVTAARGMAGRHLDVCVDLALTTAAEVSR